jgi:hypothetical protein
VCFNRKSRLNSGASCIFLFPFQVVYLVSLTLGFLLKLRGIKLRSLDEKRDMHVFKKHLVQVVCLRVSNRIVSDRGRRMKLQFGAASATACI